MKLFFLILATTMSLTANGNLFDGKSISNPLLDYLDYGVYVDADKPLTEDTLAIIKLDLNQDAYDDILIAPESTGYGHGQLHWTAYFGSAEGWAAIKMKQSSGAELPFVSITFDPRISWSGNIEGLDGNFGIVSWSHGSAVTGCFIADYIVGDAVHSKKLYDVRFDKEKKEAYAVQCYDPNAAQERLTPEDVWKKIQSNLTKLSYKEYTYEEAVAAAKGFEEQKAEPTVPAPPPPVEISSVSQPVPTNISQRTASVAPVPEKYIEAAPLQSLDEPKSSNHWKIIFPILGIAVVGALVFLSRNRK